MNIKKIFTHWGKEYLFSTAFVANFTLCFIISLSMFIFIFILDWSQILKVSTQEFLGCLLRKVFVVCGLKNRLIILEAALSLGENEHKNELLKFQKIMNVGNSRERKNPGGCETQCLKGSASIMLKVNYCIYYIYLTHCDRLIVVETSQMVFV